ncbi:MAG: hypothetical protein K1X47_05865, partial [Cyclobacteriaceae bacterium]|nr:hypothetical protein [Cyclobacteriaceae bacterium]
VGNPVLDVNGADTKHITQFPQTMKLAGGLLQFSYRGATPAYVSAWQERWVAQPAPVDKDFKVTTAFSAAHLTAGKPVDLKVQVEVLRDAEYVMVEVPIPSGCMYESKPQAGVGESHREYAYEKANIYCKQLKRGHYTFTIPLLARFAGNYTLNPALVECMYFPTIFGREGQKRVVIGRK